MIVASASGQSQHEHAAGCLFDAFFHLVYFIGDLSAAPNVAPFSSTFYQIKSTNTLILFGERAGTRTRDLLIKSQLLYRLSYALAP